MSNRKSRFEESRDEGEGLLKRRKLLQMGSSENTKSNITLNGTNGKNGSNNATSSSTKQMRNGGNKKEDNKKSKSTSFLPKINANGNRGTREMRGVEWLLEPRVLKKGEQTKKKHVESYLDTYENTKMPEQPGMVNLPDIQDKKGTVVRHQRTIGKSRTKEIIKLDVVDNGIDPVKGKFEKSIPLELPTITGHVVKPSPRSSPVTPTRPTAGSPTRSRSRKMKFPPLN